MSEQTENWTPSLEYALQDHCIGLSNAIAEALKQSAGKWFRNASLGSGLSGLALLYAYRAQMPGAEKQEAQTAVRYLEQALELAGDLDSGPHLFTGLPGVLWTVEYFKGRLVDPNSPDPCRPFDDVLKQMLERVPWYGDYGLFDGIVGLGVYLLERARHTDVTSMLELCVERLDEMAQHSFDGVTWLTPPEFVPAHLHDEAPRGFYNLGLSNGIASAIALLSHLHSKGISRDKVRSMIDGGVKWILDNKLSSEHNAVSQFPYWIGSGITPSATPMTWSHGDLGIATALLSAARSTRDTTYEAEAIRIALHAAARKPNATDEEELKDASIFNGSVGTAHLFGRLFQATKRQEFRQAAQTWFKHAVSFRQKESGIAGFSGWGKLPESEEFGLVDLPGFLHGAVGIALTMMAATRPIFPTWDRVLLADIATG